MKKSRFISAIALAAVIGIGVTAYAASTDPSRSIMPGQRLGLGRITSMRGYDYISSILKDKLGLSDSDITSALNSGKTLHDLALEKGMTQEQLTAYMLEERSKGIDAAVEKGTITKAEGEQLKAALKQNMDSCIGNYGQGRGQGQGQGCGMSGRGQGRFNR